MNPFRDMTESQIAALSRRNRAGRGNAVRQSENAAEAKQASNGGVRGAIRDGVTELRLTVNIPPSINECYTNRAGSNGKRRVLTKEARVYKEAVRTLTMIEAYFQKFRYIPKARVGLTLNFYFADRRKDVGNHSKLIEDSLAVALGFNDRVVDVLHVERKGTDPKRPRCEVVLRVLGTEAF